MSGSRTGTVLLLLLSMVVLSGADCLDTRKVRNPIVDASTDATADATVDAATDVCGGCSGSAPVCDTVSMTCVACLLNSDCSSATPVCDTSDNTCVECLPASEAMDCSGNSCNPATNQCTSTAVASLLTCQQCVSDSECAGSNEHCVPMEFMSSPRADGYCLVAFSAGCTEPYTVVTPSRVSLSGAAAAAYCGINESVTTCESVRGLIGNQQCPSGMSEDCGVSGLGDARCETVNGVMNRCTYSCSLALQCPGVTCNGGYCGS